MMRQYLKYLKMNYIETLYFTYQYELVKISADTFSHQLDRFSTEYPVISIVLFFFFN